MENTFTETTPSPVPQPKWFHNAWISRGTLLIAGLFFLMPFININCSGNKLASIRGTDMVFGSQLKPEMPKTEEKVKDNIGNIGDSVAKALNGIGDSISLNINSSSDSLSLNLGALGDSLSAGLNSIGDSLEKGLEAMKNETPFNLPNDMMGGKDKKIEPNALAIIAFAFVLLALVFSFFKNRAMAITSGVISLISALSLFFIQIQITNEIQKQMGPFNFVPITFEFTSFYWLCLLFLTVATIFSFVRGGVKTQ